MTCKLGALQDLCYAHAAQKQRDEKHNENNFSLLFPPEMTGSALHTFASVTLAVCSCCEVPVTDVSYCTPLLRTGIATKVTHILFLSLTSYLKYYSGSTLRS